MVMLADTHAGRLITAAEDGARWDSSLLLVQIRLATPVLPGGSGRRVPTRGVCDGSGITIAFAMVGVLDGAGLL